MPDAGYHQARAVMLQHGAQHKHSAYFESFGKELAAAGFECVAFDQQGTGRSGGEDPRGYVNGIEPLSGDLDRVLQSEVERHRNGTQFFLFGEGIGAVVVLHYAMRHRQTPHVYPSAVAVSGYLFCAPLLKPNAASLTREALDLGLCRACWESIS
jgi:alpha-beta hydrolase superfamily lysophospholipase